MTRRLPDLTPDNYWVIRGVLMPGSAAECNIDWILRGRRDGRSMPTGVSMSPVILCERAVGDRLCDLAYRGASGDAAAP